jgi:WD40 repeat protein
MNSCDGKPLATLQGHTGAVNSAVFAPDGGRILTASTAWSCADGRRHLFGPPQFRVRALAGCSFAFNKGQ